MDSTNKTLFKDFKIIGACMKVDRSLGQDSWSLRGSIGERIPHSEHSL
jgi:hypothetical protein